MSHASSGRRWISGYFDFTDLLPGEYRLEIDDPRFYPWTMEAIRPGSDTIEAELRGTSTIELEVFDGDSGSPCIRFAVDSTMVTYRRASRGSTIHLDDMSDHEEGRCVLSAMPAGTHVLEIWTPSREKQKATVHDVQPGEHRAHRVVFGGLTTVSGQVVRAGNNTPVPGIAVGLFEPVTRPVSPEKDLARVQTDAEGSFRFENVAPGRYILRVVDGPQRELGPLAKYGVVATIDPLVVEPGRPSVENRLVLPAHGSLRIDLRTPENASFENVKVRLRRPGPVSGLDPELLVPLGAQGPVELAPLDPGTYLLELRVEQVMLLGVGPMRTSSGQTLSLGEILIEGGRTTEETRDLRDQWPGSFRVRVSGHTWEPLRVYVRVFVPGSPSQRESFLAWVEEDGTATFPAIFEGTKQIVVHDWKDSWGYLADDPVEVRSGEATTCTVAVPFYEGTLECRGGEPEAPLARIQVQLALDDSSNRLQSPMRPGLRILTADATGTIRLRLPPATYTLTSDHGTARFEWTANGATPSIARFTRER